MGKKGVKLDNGRNAQSSMALYWKKHNEQAKKPKKQYEPTEQEQFDQRVESGFQKWKLHRQQVMQKSFAKKQEEPEKNQQVKQKNEREEEQEDQVLISQHKHKGIVKIPGFKSKQGLKQKLKPESAKQVSQADNVLRLPSHMGDLTQEDIVRILRQKKAQKEAAQRKKKNQEVEDVILGEDFLESFKAPPKPTQEQLQKQMEKKKQEEAEKQKEEPFFKSNILNQISKGNTSVIMQQPVAQVQPAVEPKTIQVEAQAEEHYMKPQPHVRPLFKPRVLGKHQ